MKITVNRSGTLNTRKVILWTTAACSLVADFFSKEVVFRCFEHNVPNPVVDNILWFTPRINKGAAFSFLAGFEHSNLLFMVVSALLIPFIVWFALKKFAEAPVFPFGLVVGGAAGNIVDRMMPLSGVRDFIDFGWWPAFNIADACIFTGVFILMGWLLLFAPKEPDKKETAVDDN